MNNYIVSSKHLTSWLNASKRQLVEGTKCKRASYCPNKYLFPDFFLIRDQIRPDEVGSFCHDGHPSPALTLLRPESSFCDSFSKYALWELNILISAGVATACGRTKTNRWHPNELALSAVRNKKKIKTFLPSFVLLTLPFPPPYMVILHLYLKHV